MTHANHHTAAEETMVVRFTRAVRVEHALVVVLFIALSLTGLPQRWPYAPASRTIIDAMGGIFAVRFMHRVAGIAFTLLAVGHVARVSFGVLRRRWAPTMFFQLKDFHDAIDSMRYHLGLAEEPPRLGRYDYRQKFEYWGILFGSAVMILSGFILFFPMFWARFMPADLIPAAKVMHANEALLALLIVLVWHLYAVVLSPEVFPLDKSIFTGKISKRRLEEEHGLEHDEIFAKEQ